MPIATLTCLPGPSPLLFLLAQLLLRLLPLAAASSSSSASSCPSLCTCSNQASRVICTRQNLEQVPHSISVNTRYLNLQENSIQVGGAASLDELGCRDLGGQEMEKSESQTEIRSSPGGWVWFYVLKRQSTFKMRVLFLPSFTFLAVLLFMELFWS